MCSTSNGSSSVPRIMVFRPTMEEFRDFSGYIAHMESQGANRAGLAKIIPPKEWCPRVHGYEDIDMVIPAPISQVVHGRQGLYQQINIQKKSISVKEFQKLAESEKYRTPNHFDYEDLERKYWRNISYNSPIYGADVSGSLYDTDVKEFNINHLDSILDLVNDDYGIRIEGVNTAYLYFGMWKTTFPWHTEDMDLYSINYLHFGAPKSWYAIPPEHGRRLERLATGFFPGNSKSCPAFLRHKMTIISPAVLRQYSIPFNKITQEPGEFMVTFPFGYHAGFNHGLNCAESTNFAMPRWVEYGKRALQCSCRNDGVKISMDVFVRKFQPDRYELWKMGKDAGTHPEDSTRVYCAPAPSKMELTASTRAEERRRYRTECGTFSKRHPVSHVDGKEDDCIKEEMESDDTEIYDIGSVLPEADKKKKRKKKKSEFDESEKPKKKIKKEPNPDKIKKKKERKESPPHLMPFYSAENFVKSQTPVKIIIKKLVVPSTTDSHMITQFEVKETPHKVQSDSPPNITGHGVFSMPPPSDNSNLMALAQLAEDVGSRMDVSRCLISNGDLSKTSGSPLATYSYKTHANNLALQKACNVAMARLPINQIPQTKVVTLPAAFQNVFRNQAQEMHLKATSSSTANVDPLLQQQMSDNLKKLQDVAVNAMIGNPSTKDAKPRLYQFPGTSNGKQNNVPTYLTLPSTLKSSSLLLNRPVKVETAVKEEHVLKQGQSVPNMEQSMPVRGSSSIPATKASSQHQVEFLKFLQKETSEQADFKKPLQSETQQQANFQKSLQNETCFHGGGHMPQTAHMYQHQKLHKMLHDYARVQSEQPPTPQQQSSQEAPLEGWAKSVSNLWQFRPADFEAEKAFNVSSSTVAPHCAICTVFKALRKDLSCTKVHLPSSSKVLMPSSVFASSTANQFVLDSNPLLAPDGTAPLLRCSRCHVCVHATCYGITQDELLSKWKCMRCSKEATDAACCLCPLRGGALKSTTDGRWAHVLCAALVPGALFGSIITKEPIDLSKIKQARLKLICIYCHKFAPRNGGVCIQCSSGKCSLSFHVTCGHAAGVVFETSNWPTPVYISCTRHLKEKKEETRQFVEVKVGDRAVAKHKNKRYYNCEVQKIDMHVYYAVDFEDGSFCDNLFPEDIISHGRANPPKVNEPVEVQWTDGNRYRAWFKGTNTQVMYTVEFENGSQLQLKREDFYTSNEELPKRVLSRMSSATDGQHTDIFEDREVDGKRIRFVNTKYHSSEVVPL